MKLFSKLFLLVFFVLAMSSAFAVEVNTSSEHMTVATIAAPNTAHVSSITPADDEPTQGKSQLVALILALLVGALGIHRFYLGYKKIGIIQLVLTLTGIFAIVSWVWALIDAINIATGDLKPADGSDYEDKI